MNLRKTKAYKEMTPYLAAGLAEGFEEGNQEEIGAAWQYLIDTGQCWHLQGWFGRTAQGLIDEGLCEPAEESHQDFYGNLVPGTNN